MAHVLIVDDNESDLELMTAILRAEGHEVHTARNGEDGLKLFLRHPVDVLVTDIHMPRGDGIELITAVKGMDQDAAIVAVSGKEPHKLQVAQLAGARAIVAKPVTQDSLREAVERACAPPDGDPFSP